MLSRFAARSARSLVAAPIQVYGVSGSYAAAAYSAAVTTGQKVLVFWPIIMRTSFILGCRLCWFGFVVNRFRKGFNRVLFLKPIRSQGWKTCCPSIRRWWSWSLWRHLEPFRSHGRKQQNEFGQRSCWSVRPYHPSWCWYRSMLCRICYPIDCFSSKNIFPRIYDPRWSELFVRLLVPYASSVGGLLAQL